MTILVNTPTWIGNEYWILNKKYANEGLIDSYIESMERRIKEEQEKIKKQGRGEQKHYITDDEFISERVLQVSRPYKIANTYEENNTKRCIIEKNDKFPLTNKKNFTLISKYLTHAISLLRKPYVNSVGDMKIGEQRISSNGMMFGVIDINSNDTILAIRLLIA